MIAPPKGVKVEGMMMSLAGSAPVPNWLELLQYETSYRLCYVRGPEGILVALAEKTG